MFILIHIHIYFIVYIKRNPDISNSGKSYSWVPRNELTVLL